MKPSVSFLAKSLCLGVVIGALACGHALDRHADEYSAVPSSVPAGPANAAGEVPQPPPASSATARPAQRVDPAATDPGGTQPSVQESAPAATQTPANAAENVATAKVEETLVRRQRDAAALARRSVDASLGVLGLASGGSQVRAPAFANAWPDFNTEQYASIQEEGFVAVADRPLSTFSIDVDTASYSNVRRFIDSGAIPPSGAVRIEELINYFAYDYPAPRDGDPFSVTTEIAGAPWNPRNKLLLVGLRGRNVEQGAVPRRNLVFLIDVSGSMMPPNKLPLVKNALVELTRQMRPEDHIAIVVYAGASGCVLEPTSGADKQKIIDALANLEAGGSTNGADGIRLAYDLAAKNFNRAGINRVILATDGDFNVGTTNESDLVELIEEKRKGGVYLTVLGVGMGNLKDSTMEKLADHGNGNYAYLDSPSEARKVLIEQANGTLMTIAKDVKIQVEFNPLRAKAYRLIGYENRRLQAKDFNDDTKDAGEIGAGHSVTALYEVVPGDSEAHVAGVDPLRYQRPGEPTGDAQGKELATVKLRYKQPDGDTSRLLSVAVDDADTPIEKGSTDLRFASGVAAFGMVLRGSDERGTASYDMALSLARDALGRDPNAYRAEFLRIVAKARDLGSRGGESLTR